MTGPEPKGRTITLKDLSVVVLSHNRKEELVSNLPVLCKAGQETGFELIVVDNASGDGSRELLAVYEKEYPNLCVVINNKNLGVAKGRNTGWRLASRRYILNIDDDINVALRDIHALVQAATAHPWAGVISPKVVHANTGITLNNHGEKTCEPANFPGACHLVRAEVLRQVGDIDPLCTFGGEELDYSIRVRSKGYSVLYVPHITVWHNDIQRSNREGLWRRKRWLYNFSRVSFKHFPIRMAGIFTFRYCVSSMVSGLRIYGWAFALSLPKQVLLGAIDGRRQYQSVPAEVKKFYTNPFLRPDFGNIPLWTKLKNLNRQSDLFVQ